MSKAIADTASETTTADSAVAEFRSHQPFHHATQPDTAGTGTASSDTTGSATHPTATLPTLSDSAVAELKAAYTAVEKAIADAKTDTTTTDATTTASSDTTSTTSDTASNTASNAADDKVDDKAAHQPPADPLVKILADATGETTATVQGVLHQIQAVLHQEHRSDGAGAQTSTDTATATTTTATSTADATAGDAPSHWHDRLAAQSGSSADGSTATAGTSGDGTALWQHHLMQHTAVDSAVTTNADVVSAVDDFAHTVQTLHLDPMHGHGVEGVHLDSAA
ncbi:hypothetical protein [Azospirillum sp. TSO35-2]|uniref:hypothetical protein n=1 Tax=Azospirillum sp. TSO35-2 TaxID=716796 RepID=UPI000D609A3F|nr:hypothetical protein [Azospirillum sp. TSO35-2]PWC35915.1 hypothetical protein TSO352_11895 [Azospirillum sp. TSO35-2]